MPMHTIAGRLVLALICALASAWTLAADGIESRPVKFAKGASSATVKSSIKGRQTIDYTLGARAGQSMSVTLKTGSTATYFNVLPPGSNDVAVFVGSTSGNEWTGTLDADGTYKVRVYLMPSAARRNEAASFTLTVGITGAPAKAATGARGTTTAGATERAGAGKFDATGNIPCAQAKGQPMGQCPYGVARAGSGTATVVVTRPDGRKRFIFFEKGKATGADLSQADGSMAFHATKQADLYLVQTGNERYEIPEAVLTGG